MSHSVYTSTRFLILAFVLLLISSCSSATTEETPAPVDTLAPIETVDPTATASPTPVTPSPTATELPPTATSTPTQTPTATPTPTSEPATLVVNQDSTCRMGPGLIYDIRAYLSEGAVPVLLGQDQENAWWSVEEPIHSATCWVSSEVVTVQGDVNSLPIFTPEPTPTIESSPTPEQKGLFYYLVALNTGGPVGCGDSLIPVYVGTKSTGDLEKDIHASLHGLLKLKIKDLDGYYNPLHNAHLSIGDISFNKSSGNVAVHFSGSIPKPKDECEYHRVRGALWETVRHYRDVKNVTFWIGNKLVGDIIAIIDR